VNFLNSIASSRLPPDQKPKMHQWAKEVGFKIHFSAPYNEYHLYAWQFRRIATKPDAS
tara:strand:- start:3544 stop:3717 length:174 start_codon:yes stop_codon:yes gene_type:complete